jgi:hypothetical protein
MPQFPPPDPCEHPYPEPSGDRLPEPLTIFPRGTPSKQVEAVADAIIEARPGLLVVVMRV